VSDRKKERPGGQTEAQAARLFDRYPTPAAVLVNRSQEAAA
jgi:hypothetical protein